MTSLNFHHLQTNFFDAAILCSIALEVRGHETPVFVSIPKSLECSTHLEVINMEWLLVGVAEPLKLREDGGQNLTLQINPLDTELDGVEFTCKIITVRGKVFEETITVNVKGHACSWHNFNDNFLFTK